MAVQRFDSLRHEAYLTLRRQAFASPPCPPVVSQSAVRRAGTGTGSTSAGPPYLPTSMSFFPTPAPRPQTPFGSSPIAFKKKSEVGEHQSLSSPYEPICSVTELSGSVLEHDPVVQRPRVLERSICAPTKPSAARFAAGPPGLSPAVLGASMSADISAAGFLQDQRAGMIHPHPEFSMADEVEQDQSSFSRHETLQEKLEREPIMRCLSRHSADEFGFFRVQRKGRRKCRQYAVCGITLDRSPSDTSLEDGVPAPMPPPPPPVPVSIPTADCLLVENRYFASMAPEAGRPVQQSKRFFSTSIIAAHVKPDRLPGRTRSRDLDPEEQKKKWTKIFQLQHSDGFWELTTHLGQLIHLNVDVFANVFLKNKGICSLGAKAHADILRMMATLLVLQLMRVEELQEGKLLRHLFHLEESPEHRSERWDQVKKAVDWVRWADRQYPCICSRLELGLNWESCTRQLLGVDSLPPFSPLIGLDLLGY